MPLLTISIQCNMYSTFDAILRRAPCPTSPPLTFAQASCIINRNRPIFISVQLASSPIQPSSSIAYYLPHSQTENLFVRSPIHDEFLPPFRSFIIIIRGFLIFRLSLRQSRCCCLYYVNLFVPYLSVIEPIVQY